jgi:hypothetical protein
MRHFIATYEFCRTGHDDGGLLRFPPARESCHEPVHLCWHVSVTSPGTHAVRNEQQGWGVHDGDAFPFQRVEVSRSVRTDLGSGVPPGYGHGRVCWGNLRWGSCRDGGALGGTMKRRKPGHGCQPYDYESGGNSYHYCSWGFGWLAVPARVNSPWWFHVATVRRTLNHPYGPVLLFNGYFPNRQLGARIRVLARTVRCWRWSGIAPVVFGEEPFGGAVAPSLAKDLQYRAEIISHCLWAVSGSIRDRPWKCAVPQNFRLPGRPALQQRAKPEDARPSGWLPAVAASVLLQSLARRPAARAAFLRAVSASDNAS